MSDQRMGDLPTGRRLDSGQAPGVVGELGTHDLATDERVALARKHYTEATPGDFTRHGRKWVDRATGAEYRRVGWDPLADITNRDESLIFFISGGRLTYLRPRGGVQQVSSVEVGSLTSGELTPRSILATSTDPGLTIY